MKNLILGTALLLGTQIKANFDLGSGFSIKIEQMKDTQGKCDRDIKVPVMLFPSGTPTIIQKLHSMNFEAQKSLTDFCDNKNVEEHDSISDIVDENSFFVKGQILSYITNGYWYGVGAHGNGGIHGTVMALATGEKFENMDDLFEFEHRKSVVKYIERGLVLEYDDNFDPSFGWNEVKKKLIKDNSLKDLDFYLSQAGVTVYFNAYHIGPYASGTYEVSIPWRKFEQWQNKRSKLIQLMKMK